MCQKKTSRMYAYKHDIFVCFPGKCVRMRVFFRKVSFFLLFIKLRNNMTDTGYLHPVFIIFLSRLQKWVTSNTTLS
jgi:hypothetical protein